MKYVKYLEKDNFELDPLDEEDWDEVEPPKKSIIDRFVDFFKTDNTCPVCGTEMNHSSGVAVGSEEGIDECHNCGYNMFDTMEEFKARKEKFGKK